MKLTKKSFEQWSNEKDRIIEEKISKIETSFKSDLYEIKRIIERNKSAYVKL